jgi:uncharacterized membrane protein YhaH (DUF805 family)
VYNDIRLCRVGQKAKKERAWLLSQAFDMNVETCSNCGQVVGKLEQAYIFHENVVCQHCYRRLTDTEDKQVQAKTERPVEIQAETVPPQTKTQGQTISCLRCDSIQITDNKTEKSTSFGKEQDSKQNHYVRHNFFSFDGRINRARYFLGLLIIGMVAGIMNVFWPSYIIVILAQVLLFPSVIKRLHDMDIGGGAALLMFIPLFGFILNMALLFAKGTTGPNEYGLDPLPKGNECSSSA